MESESDAAAMKTVQIYLNRGYTWWENRLSGMNSEQPVVAASGISLRLWRLYAQAWLVCLLFPILTLTQGQLTPLQLLLALAGLAIFVACYTRVMWSHPLRDGMRDRWSRGAALALLVGLVALVLVLSLLYGSAFLWLLVGVSAVAGVLLPARPAFLAVMLLTLLTLGGSVGIAGGIAAADWLHIVPLVLLVRGLGLDMAGLARLAGALHEVHAARGELARMAVIEERLRMARDLHDLLGHALSTITLKSELAERLVALDPARAAQEMRDVEHTARQTLREVRAAVAGYRQPTLQAELEGARQILEAAGIDPPIERSGAALPATVDAVLAWTIREGVTNVIRHSRARWCRIRITTIDGSAAAEVTNDQVCGHEPIDVARSSGSGLAGLAERVAALGGQMAAGPLSVGDDAGFRLWAELPTVISQIVEPDPQP
jgi:two-component system sensor histidine kinase DesK